MARRIVALVAMTVLSIAALVTVVQMTGVLDARIVPPGARAANPAVQDTAARGDAGDSRCHGPEDGGSLVYQEVEIIDDRLVPKAIVVLTEDGSEVQRIPFDFGTLVRSLQALGKSCLVLANLGGG